MSEVSLELIAALSKLGAVKQEKKDFTPFLKFLDDLFPLQREVMNDPAKRKCLLAGRRSSKSFTISAKLLKTALEKPKSTSIFLALTNQNAFNIIWGYLKDFNQKYALGGEFNETHHIVSFYNESTIQVAGCGDLSSTEKWRGDAYDFVAIDEAGSFGDYLSYLIDEVLSHALRECNGELWLAGTPNRHCTGYFYEATKPDSGFKTWHWTFFDNPMYPVWAGKPNWKELAEEWWKRTCNEENIDETSNSIQREVFARWIKDHSSLVLDLDESRNLISVKDLPPENSRIYVFGIDFGFNDPFAIAVGCYTKLKEFPHFYIVDGFEEAHLLSDYKARVVNEFDAKYRPIKIVVDPGGGGKQFIEDYNAKYRLNIEVESANKTEKVKYCDLMSDDCKSGKVKYADSLYDKFNVIKNLTWKDKSKNLMPQGAEDHFFDASNYAYKLWSPFESARKDLLTPPKDDKTLRIEALQKRMREEEQKKRRYGI